MNTGTSTGSSLVGTQSHAQTLASISFSTPECSPGQFGGSTGLTQESDFNVLSRMSRSNGCNEQNSLIVNENVIRKITPLDKAKPPEVDDESALDMKMMPLGNGAATSLNNHLGGTNNDRSNDPIATTQRALNSSVQDSATQLPCRQTKSNRGFVSRRGGRHGAPSPARLTTTSPPLDGAPIKEEDSFSFQHSSILTTDVPSNADIHNNAFPLTSTTASDLEREALNTLEEYAEVSVKSDPDTNSFTTSICTDTKANRFPLIRPTTAPADRNVSFSPVPPTHTARTPIRSPSSRPHYTDLPNLDITKIGSPGILLSPYLSSIRPVQNELQKSTTETTSTNQNMRPGGVTPTNFATADFGKGELSLTSFDGGNVLPWLSPTSYHLFSPGVMATTPRGMFGGIPRTPRTPTTNQLFFSDPDDQHTNSEVETKKASGPGLNDVMQICVSPLAPSKRNSTNSIICKNEYQRGLVDTGCLDINFKDVFASPKPDVRSALRLDRTLEMPTPTDKKRPNSNSTKLSLEKHMAERDLMEDEDIRLLLQLAQTTPRKNCPPGIVGNELKSNTRVFRSPRLSTKFGLRHPGEPSLISLQLPFMGRNGIGPLTPKLTRKNSRERPQMHPDDFKPHLVLGPNPSSSSCVRKPGQNIADNVKKGGKNTVKVIPKNKLKPNPSHKIKPGALGMVKNMAQLPTLPRSGPGLAPGTYSIPGHSQYGNPPIPALHQQPPHSVYPPPHPHIHMRRPGMPGHVPFHYPYPPGHPPHPYSYISAPTIPGGAKLGKNSMKKGKINGKRPIGITGAPMNKKMKKSSSGKARGSGSKKCQKNSVSPTINNPVERQKTAAAIAAMNAAAGHKNDKAAALASAIMRGVTMRPSGKWQAQLYYAGKSRYIGVFDTREKAALAYEISREKLKTDKSPSDQSAQSVKETEANVNAARKAAFEGVNEKDPRITGK
eukprot:CAMPEP_0198262448 /NCGR_PEP_ID=MMETSP1447-20131203/10951_1 /TAXON_ID=420782 /ORGANISM="Chaetoceros dichaeta, Strain CCMP1751" /LENGTH=945 /DNA_ID=CAMNT_0043950689 /DNA_START=503 /DNA_END=3340 /DNA_ORIENTATION=-